MQCFAWFGEKTLTKQTKQNKNTQQKQTNNNKNSVSNKSPAYESTDFFNCYC